MPKPILLALAFFLILPGADAQVKALPEFTFKRMADGADYARKDVPAGKKTLFLFFDTECPHCMRATSQYNQHTKEMAGATVLMVTMDTKDKVMTFLNTYGSNLYGKKNLTLLSDPNRQFISRFLPKKYPAMYLFNAKGELLLYSDEEKDVPQFIQKIK
jgi:peroxiredoxin